MSPLASADAPETPILSAPIQMPPDSQRWTSLCPRLRLYADRIELTRWWGWRRVWRRIPLARLAEAKAPSPITLRLRPRNEEPLVLGVEEARQWARTIRAFRACLVPPDAEGPDADRGEED